MSVININHDVGIGIENKELVTLVKQSMIEAQEGKGVLCTTSEELENYFDSLSKSKQKKRCICEIDHRINKSHGAAFFSAIDLMCKHKFLMEE
jgi:hypothetical protein